MTKWLRNRQVRVLALAVGMSALLAACSGGSGASATTPTGGGTQATAATTQATASTTASATPTATLPLGAYAQPGISDLCKQAVSVSAQLPTSIPTYPGAQLRVSQTSGADGLFGLCTSDAVDSVATFYTQKLPEKGWQHLTSTTIQTTQQVMATQGNAHIIVTIEPDGQLSGVTDIIILTSGA